MKTCLPFSSPLPPALTPLVDRARAVYAHAAQFSDPRSSPTFYEAWRRFEIKYGNEDTFREMLRVKRSVSASFQTDVNFTASEIVKATDDMHRAELEANPQSGQVRSFDFYFAFTLFCPCLGFCSFS